MVWEGYTDSVFTAPFERACGVKITATYMGSSDDLVAKLRAGGSQTIDLISPSSDAITEIIQAGLAAALDTTRLPSFGDLMAGFRALPVARSGGKIYGEPWAFGPNPLIYDSTKVTPKPASWAVLWDDRYKGRISVQDDIATLYMIAQYLGLDDPKDPSKLYNLSDADLEKVKAKAMQLRPRVRKYWSTAGDMTQLFQSGEIVLGEGWPLMTHQLLLAKFPAAEVIPERGDHGVGGPLGADLRRAEPGRGVCVAGVRGAAIHAEDAGGRHGLHCGESCRADLHDAGAGDGPARHRRVWGAREFLAVGVEAGQVSGDLERGQSGAVMTVVSVE